MKTKIIILILLSISLFSAAQNGSKTIKETIKSLVSLEGVNYFEVSQEMFNMLSESENIAPEFKAYISKLHQLKMIQGSGANRQQIGLAVYQKFSETVNLKDYTRLMTRKEANSSLSFYKKENKTENEFLLLSTEMIIYITGTLDLKSIGEFEQVMEIAGSAFDM